MRAGPLKRAADPRYRSAGVKPGPAHATGRHTRGAPLPFERLSPEHIAERRGLLVHYVDDFGIWMPNVGDDASHADIGSERSVEEQSDDHCAIACRAV